MTYWNEHWSDQLILDADSSTMVPSLLLQHISKVNPTLNLKHHYVCLVSFVIRDCFVVWVSHVWIFFFKRAFLECVSKSFFGFACLFAEDKCLKLNKQQHKTMFSAVSSSNVNAVFGSINMLISIEMNISTVGFLRKRFISLLIPTDKCGMCLIKYFR